MSSTIPELNYGAVQKPGVDSQIGCIYCLADDIHAPVSIVYYWNGTSMCQKHVLKALNDQKGQNAQNHYVLD